MAPRTEASTATADNGGDASPSPGKSEEELIMGYTHAECVAALQSIEGPNADETCRHIFGHGNPDHRLSMLQKVTAVRILDYQKNMVSVLAVFQYF